MEKLNRHGIPYRGYDDSFSHIAILSMKEREIVEVSKKRYAVRRTYPTLRDALDKKGL